MHNTNPAPMKLLPSNKKITILLGILGVYLLLFTIYFISIEGITDLAIQSIVAMILFFVVLAASFRLDSPAEPKKSLLGIVRGSILLGLSLFVHIYITVGPFFSSGLGGTFGNMFFYTNMAVGALTALGGVVVIFIGLGRLLRFLANKISNKS